MLRIIIILISITLAQCQSCSLSCQQNGNYRNTNDRHSYIQCNDGKATLISCAKSSDGYNRLIFNGEKCIEQYNCPQNGLFPHPHKDLYWRCDNGVALIQRCPSKQQFVSSHGCVPEFNCPELSGSFANSNNKSEYYQCCMGAAQLYFCPNSLIYEQGSNCVPVFQCPQTNGKYRNLRKETQYYQCIDGEAVLRTCPPKQIFNGLNCVEKFECPLPDGKFINRLDKTNRTYYLCRSSTVTEMTCPGTQVFYGQECEDLFRCPTPDGRFANPQNQNKYYMCEKNVPYPHQCQQGFEFNEDKQDCQKQFQCPSAFGRFKYPDNNTKFYECDNFRPQMRYCPIGKVFNGNKCTKIGNGFQCQAMGVYKHPTDRHKYYYCGKNLEPKLQECSLGRLFDDVLKTCVRSQYRCPTADGRFPHPHNEAAYFECRSGSAQLVTCPLNQKFDKYSRVCTGDQQQYNCPQPDGLFSHPLNRSLFHHCRGGVTYLRQCGHNQVFDQSQQNCIEESTTYQCPRPNGMFPYPHDDRRYYLCRDGIYNLNECRIDERFDQEHLRCLEIDHQRFRCPQADGLFSHPSNPKLFYHCKSGRKHLRNCGTNKVFDQGLQNCVNEVADDNEDYRCPQPDGLFPYPSDRRRYYLCRNNIWLLVSCPAGQQFNHHNCVYQCPAPDGLYKHETNQSRFYYCKNNHAELRECASHHIFNEDHGRCIPWSWPASFYCPLPNGNFINPQNNSQYFECCQGMATLRSCPSSEIFNGRHCISEIVYSCNNDQNNHPTHSPHCFNGHRYQYSCPYSYGTDLVYNGYRCVPPFHCPTAQGIQIVRNPSQKHQYYRCANGLPSLYTCSRGFTYDDRRGCCVYDEHLMSGYFGYKVNDRTDPRNGDYDRNSNKVPVFVVDPFDRHEQDKFAPNQDNLRQTDRGVVTSIPGMAVVEPIDRHDQDIFTREPEKFEKDKIPTLPVNEPVEVRPDFNQANIEYPTTSKINELKNDLDEDDDDNDLDEDYKDEDAIDEEYNDNEDDEQEKFRRSLRNWEISKLI